MLLKHARETVDGLPIENTFEAIDEKTGALIASCTIYPFENAALYPSRPLRILMQFEGDSVPDILLGGAIARAKDIAHQSSLSSRIYAELAPDDDDLLDKLKIHGFSDNDGLVLMERMTDGELHYRLPVGCVTVMDELDDPIEQKYFLDRYNLTFGEAYDFEWLERFRSKHGFKRILIVSTTGMVGETVVWEDDHCGKILWIFVAKKWREMGVSATLTDIVCAYFAKQDIFRVQAEVQARMPRILPVMEAADFTQSTLLCRYPGVDIDPV